MATATYECNQVTTAGLGGTLWGDAWDIADGNTATFASSELRNLAEPYLTDTIVVYTDSTSVYDGTGTTKVEVGVRAYKDDYWSDLFVYIEDKTIINDATASLTLVSDISGERGKYFVPLDDSTTTHWIDITGELAVLTDIKTIIEDTYILLYGVSTNPFSLTTTYGYVSTVTWRITYT